MKTIITCVVVAFTVLILAGHLRAQPSPKAEASYETFISSYLVIQEALAADNLQNAKNAASTLQTELPDTIGKASEAIAEAAKAIRESPDLAKARLAFLQLSNHMAILVSKAELANTDNLYLAYCPMAFDNKGASWIQSGKVIKNPYYGASMLRCGSIKKPIKQTKTEADPDSHNTHH